MSELNKSKKVIHKLVANCVKWTFELSGNVFRNTTLPKSYLAFVGIIKESLKSIEQRANRYGWTDPNYRKASLLKI